MKKIIFKIFLALILVSNYSLAQWEQLNVPGNPVISAVTEFKDFLYAGTYAGIFRSSDEGINCEAITNGLPENVFVTSMTRDHYFFI